MNRVGAAPSEIVGLARAVDAQPGLALAGVWTHCAVADEPGNPFTDVQLDRFDAVCADLDAAGLLPPLRHTGNSAVAIDHRRGHLDLVRCGIAVYGLPPVEDPEGRAFGLEPAMAVSSELVLVKKVEAGQGVSYGHEYVTPHDTTLGLVSAGYADGVFRAAGGKGEAKR